MIIEPKAVIIITSFLFIICLIFYQTTKKFITNWGYLRQNHDALRFKHLQQGIGGIKDIKLLGREKEFLREFSIHTEGLKKTGIKSSFMSLIPRLGIEYLSILIISIILFFATIYEYEKDIIIATLAVFTAAAFRMLPSVNRIITNLQGLRHSLPVTERLYREFIEAKNIDISKKKLEKNFNNQLEFKNVFF